MWYGLRLGLGMTGALAIPFGELLDLISCEQIKHEGWEAAPPPRTEPLTEEEEAEAFFKLMDRR